MLDSLIGYSKHQMSTAKRVAFNSIYQLVGKLVTLGISLVMVSFLARRLGVAAYGDYTIAIAYSQLFAIVADFGISMHLLKRLGLNERFGRQEGELLGLVTEVRVVTAIIGSIIALIVALFLPYSSDVIRYISVALVAVILQMINSLYVTVLQSRLEMKYAAFSEVVGRAVMLVGAIIAIANQWGILGVIGAQVVGNIVNLAITYRASRLQITPIFKFNSNEWAAVLRSSVVLGLTSILSYIYFKTDTLLLSVLDIPGKINSVEVGLYGTAYKMMEILILVPGIVLGSVFPLLTGAIAKGDHDRTQQLIDRTLQLMASVGCVVSTGLWLFATPIIHFIAGESYLAASIPLGILAFAIPPSFVSGVFSYALLALDQQRKLAYLYGVAAILNVLVNILLIPRYSYIAAAWVTVGTECIVAIGGYLLLNSTYALHYAKKVYVYIVLAVVSLALVLWYARDISILAGILMYLVGSTVIGLFLYPIIAHHRNEIKV